MDREKLKETILKLFRDGNAVELHWAPLFGVSMDELEEIIDEIIEENPDDEISWT